MSDSSSSSDGEMAKLREAVQGAVPGVKRISQAAKVTTREDRRVTSRQLSISEDMQRHIAKKLSQYLDSQYETVAPSLLDTSTEHLGAQTSAIRLLSHSKSPLRINTEQANDSSESGKKLHKRKLSSDSSGSDFTENELGKLKEAAIDPQTITGHKSKRTKH